MGSACRGETDKPRCPDHRCAADVVAKLGTTGSLPGEARSHIAGLGGARRPACRPGAHLGFTRGSGSAPCSSRRSSACSHLGIPGGSGSPGAQLGCAHACTAAPRGRANLGCAAAIDFAAARPRRRRARAVMGRSGRTCAAGSAARSPGVADAHGALVEPARSCMGSPSARRLRARCARLRRLGCTGARRWRTAPDRRTVVGGSGCASAIHVAVARME